MQLVPCRNKMQITAGLAACTSACMPEQQEATAGMKNHIGNLLDSLGQVIAGESSGCILLDVRRSYGG